MFLLEKSPPILTPVLNFSSYSSHAETSSRSSSFWLALALFSASFTHRVIQGIGHVKCIALVLPSIGSYPFQWSVPTSLHYIFFRHPGLVHPCYSCSTTRMITVIDHQALHPYTYFWTSCLKCCDQLDSYETRFHWNSSICLSALSKMPGLGHRLGCRNKATYIFC